MGEQKDQAELAAILRDFQALIKKEGLALRKLNTQVEMEKSVIHDANNGISVQKILEYLTSRFGTEDEEIFEVLLIIAKYNKTINSYDSYPLDCIRKGKIKNQH